MATNARMEDSTMMIVAVLDGGNGMVKVVMHGRIVNMSTAEYNKWIDRMTLTRR